VIAGRVPTKGERLVTPSGWTLEIVAADERRVQRLRLHPPKPVPEGAEA
jgi:CBS domain containing-hemolysin-like protein